MNIYGAHQRSGMFIFCFIIYVFLPLPAQFFLFHFLASGAEIDISAQICLPADHAAADRAGLFQRFFAKDRHIAAVLPEQRLFRIPASLLRHPKKDPLYTAVKGIQILIRKIFQPGLRMQPRLKQDILQHAIAKSRNPLHP